MEAQRQEIIAAYYSDMVKVGFQRRKLPVTLESSINKFWFTRRDWL